MFGLKLKDTLSTSAASKGEDVLAMKSALQDLGEYEEPGYGMTPFPDTPMFDGMKRVQKKNGLSVDGIARPGGPTETTVNASLARKEAAKRNPPTTRARSAGQDNDVKSILGRIKERQKQAANRDRTAQKPQSQAHPQSQPVKLTDSVGGNRSNRPSDVVALKNALSWVGHYPVDKAHKADPSLDEDLTWGLHAFQRDFGLKQDGLSNPGGETEARLNTLITPMIQLAALNAATPPNQSGTPPDPQQETPVQQTAPRRQQAQSQPPAQQPTQPAPANQARPAPVPPIPTYTDTAGNTTTRVTQADWDSFHSAMDTVGVSALEREVFGSIYSAEGGGRTDGTTVAGITEDIIEGFHDNQEHRWQAQRLDALGIPQGTAPDTLTPEQQVEVYRLFFDEVIGPAKASGGAMSGMQILEDRIGDPATITAIADTLFRKGGPDGVEQIQEAIN